MAHIPEAVRSQPLPELKHLNSGKVREAYGLTDGLLLMLATNRVSIFDFVLNALVPQKGEVLTAMNIFWRRKLENIIGHDLIACGAAIDPHLPEALRGDPDLQKRATVVQRYAMDPVESIARGYLTGSGWTAYHKSGAVCGHRLPAGLYDGWRLPFIIFTPTTKAIEGHDEHLDAGGVAEKYGFGIERLTLQLYQAIADYAAQRGCIFADTKFEFGRDKDVQLVLCDEAGTPDSSRFWLHDQWLKAVKDKKSPGAFDKQFVREWGKTHSVDKRDPKNADDVAWVHALEVPADVLTTTTRLYRYIFWKLVGSKLEKFQAEEMGITVPMPSVRLEIVLGSRTDEGQMLGLDGLSGRAPWVSSSINFCSCHRNPEELMHYARDVQADVIIAGAGMSAQLPGVLKAWLDHFGKSHIPVIGVGFRGEDEGADLAATSAIEYLPGNPVQLNADGEAYFGPEGFSAALDAAAFDEFLLKANAKKPALFSVPYDQVFPSRS